MKTHDDLQVEMITNGPFAENCYVAVDRASRDAIVIDPGDEEQRILQRVRELEVNVRQIVCTHGHIDHAGAVAPLKRLLGAPFAIHPDETPLLQALSMQASAFGLPSKECPDVDQELNDGDTVRVGHLAAKVVLTPGHSPGGCCLLFSEQQVLFAGDTLFAGSIGRADLPGGDAQVLLAAIAQRLLPLDDAVVVYSGHGPPTTIGAERRDNPFLKPGFTAG